MLQKDIRILRTLAKRIAEIAALPIQEKTKRQWYALNSLKPERPMFTIDQIPWHEMDVNGELENKCENTFARELETQMLRQLYKWEHMRDDFVFEPIIYVPKKIDNVAADWAYHWGIEVEEDLIQQGTGNDVSAHNYHDQLAEEEDLEKLHIPEIKLDKKETAFREELAHEAFDGVLEVIMNGYCPSLFVWDDIVRWRGGDNVIMDITFRPEFIHKIMARCMKIAHAALDILENEGLLGQPQQLVHCAGAWTDELPAEGFDPDHIRAKDLWAGGMAQILSTVSPKMHKEFEIDYVKDWYERFGLVAYGCCEPLEDMIDIVTTIKSVRKISMSPWVKNRSKAAEQMGKNYVYWAKPNPSYLVTGHMDADVVGNDMRDIINTCGRYGTPVEFDLKDISTAGNRPEVLWEWAALTRSIVED